MLHENEFVACVETRFSSPLFILHLQGRAIDHEADAHWKVNKKVHKVSPNRSCQSCDLKEYSHGLLSLISSLQSFQGNPHK